MAATRHASGDLAEREHAASRRKFLVRRASTATRVAAAAGIITGLYWCFWRLSWTVPATSDGAAEALQAHYMLHGNWLLHGWTIGDVSFYTTELPEYVLVELVHGLGIGTIHIAAAITYTLLLLLTGLLARGRERGSEGLARGLTAAVIMLAPQLGYGAFVLLLSPDHTGTQVPLLAGWLLLDLAPRRWYVPVALGLLLAWVQVADQVSVVTAVVPLIAVCCWRVLRGRARRRPAATAPDTRRPSCYWEIALAGAAVASFAVAELADKLISAAGGPQVSPLAFTPSARLWIHLQMTGEGLLELFGANFAGVSGWPGLFFAGVHLAGLALAAAGLVAAGVRLLRCRSDADLVSGVLSVAIVGNLVSYLVTIDPGPSIGSGYAAREIAAVLPLGAVLAGRELRVRVPVWRRATALSGDTATGHRRWMKAEGRSGEKWALIGMLLTGYAAALGYGVAQPAAPGQYSALATWLVAHGFTYGLGGAVSNVTTLDSGGNVWLAGVVVRSKRVVAQHYQSQLSDYNPKYHDVGFLVTGAPSAGPGRPGEILSYAAVTDTFGKPLGVYRFSGFTVMTWNRNLLKSLGG
jgi:hypothetical protein